MLSVMKNKLEEQLSFLRQAISTTKDVMEESINQYVKEQNERNLNLKVECEQLNARIVELESKECSMCGELKQKLVNERRLRKSANSRLQLIGSLLRGDDGLYQTSTLTNAQLSRMTQILEDTQGVDSNKKRKLTLTAGEEENLQTDKKLNSKIIVPETMEILETQKQDQVGIIIPETQIDDESVINNSQLDEEKEEKGNSSLIGSVVPKDNKFTETDEKNMKRIRAERLALSTVNQFKKTKNVPTTSCSKSEKQQSFPETLDRKQKENSKREFNQTKDDISSPSVISKEVHGCDTKQPFRKDLYFDINIKEAAPASLRNCEPRENSDAKKESYWKLKPSLLIKTENIGKQDGCSKKKKNLKQTTLSLGVVEKKHDISAMETFNGGVANSYKDEEEDDSDVVFDSPKRKGPKVFKKQSLGTKTQNNISLQSSESTTRPPLNEVNSNNSPELTMKLETNDLDETLFNPAATSTCVPALPGDSYDRLPEVPQSPNYKYKREPVRKKEERKALLGWSCGECAKYYEVAGHSLSKEEIQQRMNACSRHRDKYPLRPKTPPGFWDPLIPPSE